MTASDFRFQISDPKRSTQQNFFFQISYFIFQISDRPTQKFCWKSDPKTRRTHFKTTVQNSAGHRFQISDPRILAGAESRLVQISDFRFQISMPSHRFQISDFRKQRSRARSQRKGDFRFQISDFRCWMSPGVGCPLQISDFRLLGCPGLWRVRFLSFRFQKAQIRSHRPRNIDSVPREKTRKNTGRSQRETCYHHYSIRSGTLRRTRSHDCDTEELDPSLWPDVASTTPATVMVYGKCLTCMCLCATPFPTSYLAYPGTIWSCPVLHACVHECVRGLLQLCTAAADHTTRHAH